jgi:hypothetical protein
MSNFPMFHGITLADNAYVENLNVEVLSSDPMPVGAGRIWYNSTDKHFKMSTLDATGAVVVRSFATVEEVDAAVAQLQSDYTAAVAAEQTRAVAAEAQVLADAKDYADSLDAAQKTYIDSEIANLVDGAPAVLDTLKELADALRANPNVLTAIENTINSRIDGVAADLATEVARAQAAELVLTNDLATEVADRIAAVSTEETARIAGDNALDGRLTTVEGQVNGKIGNLATLHTTDQSSLVNAINEVQDELDAEVARAQAAELVLTNDLASEVARAQAAELVLTNDLASEVARAQAAEAAEASRAQAAEAAEASRAQAAELVLTNDLASEVSRAQAAELVLTNGLAQEVADRTAAVAAEASRAQAAEATLTSDLAAEVARAQAAELVLTNDLASEAAARIAAVSAEQTRAQAAEATLTSDLASEVSRAQAAELVLTNDLATEVAARTAADSAIRSDYNATMFTFQSGAAANTHIVAHGLNASFVDFTVLVERANGTYRNDVVSVEEVDTNTLKVYLSSAQNIKMSVRSMVAL